MLVVWVWVQTLQIEVDIWMEVVKYPYINQEAVQGSVPGSRKHMR